MKSIKRESIGVSPIILPPPSLDTAQPVELADATHKTFLTPAITSMPVGEVRSDSLEPAPRPLP
jgi:hypothetical protein